MLGLIVSKTTICQLLVGWIFTMPQSPPNHRPGGTQARQAGNRHADAERRKRHEYRKWYNRADWKRIRLAYLAIEPLCRRCLATGILNDGSKAMDGTPQASRRRRHLIVNHIGGHGGDRQKFLNGPFETLCPDHHDIVAQAEERGGEREAIDPLTGLGASDR